MSASTLSSHGGQVFDVDQLTGDVTVVGQVDREVTPVYRLLISARDRSNDPASSTSADAIVIVRVTDENDNQPSISINTLLQASCCCGHRCCCCCCCASRPKVLSQLHLSECIANHCLVFSEAHRARVTCFKVFKGLTSITPTEYA